VSTDFWSDVKLPLVPGTALVTGGGRGIGGAVVAALAAQGAPVAAVDVAPPDAGSPRGERIVHLQHDVRDFDAAAAAVHAAEARFGPVTMLVGCAGIRRDAASWKMSESEWRDVLDVDLTGCFTVARAAAPRMRELDCGRIVFIGSINGLRGKFGQANYAAAKAGLVGLAKTLARELGPRRITVNVVAPGMVRTGMTADLESRFLEQARQESVLGCLGEPDDVAAAVVFLCSSLARHITGAILRVDGGQAM
jgi:acetoacetyl-CoA reductase/3-oxoacyl-[acyl-carrier protein] reductase